MEKNNQNFLKASIIPCIIIELLYFQICTIWFYAKGDKVYLYLISFKNSIILRNVRIHFQMDYKIFSFQIIS